MAIHYLSSRSTDAGLTGAHNGIALDNIRSRLASIYRDQHSGEVTASLVVSMESAQFSAQLTLPQAIASENRDGLAVDGLESDGKSDADSEIDSKTKVMPNGGG